MRPLTERLRPAWLAWLASVRAVLGSLRQASACGAFAIASSKADDPAAHLPFLAVGQVPLVWDKATGIEDFVHETRFSFTKESPTP